VAWFNFTALLGNLPSAGVYVNMIVRITKEAAKFLGLFLSTLVAFALAFHVLSGGRSHQFADPVRASSIKAKGS